MSEVGHFDYSDLIIVMNMIFTIFMISHRVEDIFSRGAFIKQTIGLL